MTKARERQFTKRVEWWQSALGALGVSHYTIDGVRVVDEHDGTTANVTPSTDYDRAFFEFNSEAIDHAYDEADFEYLDQVILHEWLHVAFQGFENSIRLAEGHMAPAAEGVWQEALDHSREQLIDRLARQLYAAFKDNVVLYSL